MTAKYEWTDSTGLRHPSLVYLDVTEVAEKAGVESELDLEFERTLELATVLKVKQIDSFRDVFDRGRIDGRKVRVRGYDRLWHHKVMNREYYALFVAFRRKSSTAHSKVSRQNTKGE